MALTQRGIGRPDYAQSIASAPVVRSLLPYKKTQTLSDMAELAARIGGPISIDRRGDVIWWDDFEGGLGKWYPSAGGEGTFSLSAGWCKSGALSCRYLINASGNMVIYLTLPKLNGKVGLEFTVASIWSTLGSLLVACDRRDNISGYQRRPRVRLQGNGNLQFLSSDGSTYTNFGSVPLGSTMGWGVKGSTLKLVMDYDAKKYMRAVVDGVTYDLSTNSFFETPVATGAEEGMLFWIQITNGDTGSAQSFYLDDVIVTINEPDNE